MNTLYDKTMKLLEQDVRSLRQIAKEVKLPYDWLVGVRYKRIKNPSVNRIQKLYEYLSGQRLSV